jgi:hypothetical protein
VLRQRAQDWKGRPSSLDCPRRKLGRIIDFYPTDFDDLPRHQFERIVPINQTERFKGDLVGLLHALDLRAIE